MARRYQLLLTDDHGQQRAKEFNQYVDALAAYQRAENDVDIASASLWAFGGDKPNQCMMSK